MDRTDLGQVVVGVLVEDDGVVVESLQQVVEDDADERAQVGPNPCEEVKGNEV